ncbi:RluA family pseudouridine synthase [Caminibacter mediatlanticus TB-2]|uniref:Pseudouridine synthase n=1 Tax=Caminibacter mediatlanticus TB-2 TaxID=391592 RepID=A0ABX5VCZ6_9BACT|nr:RluA family pseudouridine synthase [Caminibacter mediatlanticus]QCT95115.1 RluA family pseudouridine synthase [Caminibacter mediatlanticus TB-2]
MQIFICDKNERLDKFLANKLNVSRNQIEQLIKKGYVKVNEKVVTKSGYKLKENEKVEVSPPKIEEKETKKADFDIPILYEDEDLLVINKPPGIVVHPAPSYKEATLVDWLKQKGYSLSTIAGEERFGIVHRIDKETSGALVIAKNNKTHEFLSNQLKDKSMGRYYLMLLNEPLKEAKCVEEKIGRNPKNRLKMAIVNNGKEAKTLFVPIFDNLTAAKLYTGRTHQIRVHLTKLGRYILGDTTYGKKEQKINRVMLHAREIYFTHPNGKKLSIIAPLFDDFKNLLPKGNENEKINNLSSFFNNYDRMCK